MKILLIVLLAAFMVSLKYSKGLYVEVESLTMHMEETQPVQRGSWLIRALKNVKNHALMKVNNSDGVTLIRALIDKQEFKTEQHFLNKWNFTNKLK